ncbi:MAG: hypothetical protein R3B82_07220 [Sandaracinaceae bacterium]
MRATTTALFALLSGCTLIAPFGDLTSGDVDGGGTTDAGPGTCITRPMIAPEDPLPMGMGTEVCNREDDDGDGTVDHDLLQAETARVVTVLDRVLDVRGMRGGGDDRYAVVATVGDGIAESLRLVELYLPDGFAPQQATLVEGEVHGFDGARVRDGWAVAYSIGGEIRIGLASECDLGFGTSVITIAGVDSPHVRVDAVNPLSVLVTWETAAGEVGAALVDVRDGPRVDVMHPNLLADIGLTAGHDPDAFHDGSGVAQVTFGARDSSGQEGVWLRPVGGSLGPEVTVVLSNGFFGTGPFTDPVGASSSTGALVVPLDEAAPSGSAFVTGSTIIARRYGPPAEILGVASSETLDVGVMMDFAGSPIIERVGPEVGGNFSQDTAGISLALERWRDIVGIPRGRTRYVAVGQRAAGTLVTQRIGCF